MAPIAVTRGSYRSLRFAVHSAVATGSESRSWRKRSGASVTIVRNFKQSKYFPLNPTRLWRNSAGPGDVTTIAKKQIINKGASKTIPDTANMMSINRFERNPVGCGDPVAENRRLRTPTRPFMSGTPKNNFKNKSPLPLLLYSFFIKLMGDAQFPQACI